MKRLRDLEERLLPALAPALALAGMAAIALSTRYGPGVGGDATIYLTSAHNLRTGIGLGIVDAAGQFRLLPYFAPFYPLLLAALDGFVPDLVQAARWLNILLFGGLILVMADGARRATSSRGAGGLAAGLLAFSPILIPVFSWAMSEPLALTLGFAGLLLAWRGLNEERPILLTLSAICSGLSLLTRYSSLAFVGAAVVGLLVLDRGSLARRLRTAGLYALVALLPMLAWLVVDTLLTSTVASRSVESAAGMLQRLAAFWPQLGAVLLGWVAPYSWQAAPPYPSFFNRLIPLGLALLAGLLLAGQARRARQDARARLAALLGLFLAAYLGLVLLVYSTTYPPITIDARMLSPLYVAFLWALVIIAWPRAGQPFLWRRLAWLGVGLLVLFAVWNGARSVLIVRQNIQTGLGYTAPAWRNSPTLAAVALLPPDAPLVTNEANALQFLLGRRAYPVMEVFRYQPAPEFTRYGDGDLSGDDGQALFRAGKAYLVLFDSIDAQMESLYGQRTAARLQALTDGLTVVFRGADGAIYSYANP